MHRFLCLCRGKHNVDTRSIDFSQDVPTPPTYATDLTLAELVYQDSVEGRFPDGTTVSYEKTAERKRGVNCGFREERRSNTVAPRSQSRRTISHTGAGSKDRFVDRELDASLIRRHSRSRGSSNGNQTLDRMVPISGDEFVLSNPDMYILSQGKEGGQDRKGKNASFFDLTLSSDSSQGLKSAQVDWRSSEDLSDTSCSVQGVASMGNRSDGSTLLHSASSQPVDKRPSEVMGSKNARMSASSLLLDNHKLRQGAGEAEGWSQGVPILDLSRVRRTGSYCSNVMTGGSGAVGHSVSDTPRRLQQWQIDLNLRWVGEDDDDLVAEVRLTDDATPRTPGVGPITSDQNPPVLSSAQNEGFEISGEEGRVTPSGGSVPKGIMDVVDRFLLALKTPAPHKHPTPETRKPLKASPQRQNKSLDPASAPHEIQDDIADVEAMRIVMGKGGASHCRQPSSLRRQVILDDMKSQLGRLGDLLGSSELPRFTDVEDVASNPMDLEKAILEDVRLEVMRLEEELVRMGEGVNVAAGQNGFDEVSKNTPGNPSVPCKAGQHGGRLNKDGNRSRREVQPRPSVCRDGERSGLLPRRVSRRKSSKVQPGVSKPPRGSQRCL